MTIPQEKNSTSTTAFVIPAKTRLRDFTGAAFLKVARGHSVSALSEIRKLLGCAPVTAAGQKLWSATVLPEVKRIRAESMDPEAQAEGHYRTEIRKTYCGFQIWEQLKKSSYLAMCLRLWR